MVTDVDADGPDGVDDIEVSSDDDAYDDEKPTEDADAATGGTMACLT